MYDTVDTVAPCPISDEEHERGDHTEISHEVHTIDTLHLLWIIPKGIDDKRKWQPIKQYHKASNTGIIADQHQYAAYDQEEYNRRQQQVLPPCNTVGRHGLLSRLKVDDGVICLVQKDEGDDDASD